MCFTSNSDHLPSSKNEEYYCSSVRCMTLMFNAAFSIEVIRCRADLYKLIMRHTGVSMQACLLHVLL